MKAKARRGGALIVALWIIAVLSVMVFSFAYEAHQQAGINVFVRERNRVRRLVEPGRMIGETVLLGYSSVQEWTEGEDEEDLDEEDRFYQEKRDLKKGGCTIGPLLLDEEDEDSGTVTIEIMPANTPETDGGGGININELFHGDSGKSRSDASKTEETSSGDKNYAQRWKLILKMSGVHEETEVDVPNPDGNGSTRHNLMNLLIASWNDWRDPDESDVTNNPLELDESGNTSDEDRDGAEKEYYEKLNKKLEEDARGKAGRNAAKEEYRTPRNGEIPDLKELQYIRGFRDYPSVLRGGLLYDGIDDKLEEDPIANPRLTGIMDFFCTSGNAKFMVNSCTTNQLMTIPGIFDKETLEDDSASEQEMAEAMSDAASLATAIVNARFEKPRDWDSSDLDESADHWDYKDAEDLKKRVKDYDGEEVDIRNIDTDQAIDDAKEYLSFSLEESTIFRMTIRAESMGMKHEVVAECYVKDSKVRYISWRED